MKKILLFILILFVLYLVGLFAFTEKTRSFGDSIGLKNFNDFILKFKGDLDNKYVNFDIKTISSGATDLIDNASKYAKGIKSKIDSARSTVNDLEGKYKEAKEKIEETKKAIDDTSKNINQLKTNVNNLIN